MNKIKRTVDSLVESLLFVYDLPEPATYQLYSKRTGAARGRYRTLSSIWGNHKDNPIKACEESTGERGLVNKVKITLGSDKSYYIFSVDFGQDYLHYVLDSDDIASDDHIDYCTKIFENAARYGYPPNMEY